MTLKSPYPYFGGKSTIADLVWDRLGKVETYIEPFFGSGAVLLANPHWEKCVETINDLDHFVANVWRSLKADPDQTAWHADFPVSEVDLHARHVWLVNDGKQLILKCQNDPEFYDPKVAGWWLWGIANWIGSGWCSGRGPWTAEALANGFISEANDTNGITKKLPHLGGQGKGVNRQLPHLGDQGKGLYPTNVGLIQYCQSLAERLRRVRICCGDWERICQPAVHCAGENGSAQAISGIFLDPPYSDAAGRDMDLYAIDCGSVALRVFEWAKANGSNPNMRIALCGYQGEVHEQLEGLGWSVVEWKSAGGYSGFAACDTGRNNRAKERIWFSPACLADPQQQLL